MQWRVGGLQKEEHGHRACRRDPKATQPLRAHLPKDHGPGLIRPHPPSLPLPVEPILPVPGEGEAENERQNPSTGANTALFGNNVRARGKPTPQGAEMPPLAEEESQAQSAGLTCSASEPVLNQNQDQNSGPRLQPRVLTPEEVLKRKGHPSSPLGLVL